MTAYKNTTINLDERCKENPPIESKENIQYLIDGAEEAIIFAKVILVFVFDIRKDSNIAEIYVHQ